MLWSDEKIDIAAENGKSFLTLDIAVSFMRTMMIEMRDDYESKLIANKDAVAVKDKQLVDLRNAWMRQEEIVQRLDSLIGSIAGTDREHNISASQAIRRITEYAVKLKLVASFMCWLWIRENSA